MNTIHYKCGCSISSGMFGNNLIFDISCCQRHSSTEKVQEKLKDLRAVLVDLIKGDTL
jgi:hypothetical protein